MADSYQPSSQGSNLPKYFHHLSQTYPRQTGNSTRNLFAQIAHRVAPILSDSIIHDNASGPGTATGVILSNLPPDVHPQIVATDMVPAMIDAFKSTEFPGINPNHITGIVMKSETLAFPANHFTHSLTNFSVFNFADPSICVREIHRTLKPSGQAVITTWKRFGIGEVVHETQRRVRPDLPLMKFSGPDMYSADAVVDVMLRSGFARDKIDFVSMETVATGEDLDGLRAFAEGPFTESARRGWTEEEKDRWGVVLGDVLEEERERFGGVRFEGWAVVATKGDEQ